MSEIEKQFFETFGIEPKFDRMLCDNNYQCNGECNNCSYQKDDNKHKFYPQITDRILLKLLSIQSYEKSYYTLSPFDNIDELKKDLLNEFIDGYTYDLYNDREDVKHQVQALFKEDN